MTLNLSEARELKGSPMTLPAGDIIRYAITYPDTVSLDSDSFMHAWQKNNDVSGTILSGSLSVDGRVLTLKIISGEVGGNEYVYTFRATCQSQKRVYYFRRNIVKESLS